MSEAQILQAVRELMERHPKVAYCWRNSVGGATFHGKHYRLGEPGSSDLLGFTTAGKIIAIECKAPRGKLTKAQERFLGRVRSAGGISGVARSVDEALTILEAA
jgi:hypothetical protein